MTSVSGCIGVIALGEVPKAALEEIVDQIGVCFRLQADMLSPLRIPLHAYDKRRMQYNAGALIKSLETMGFPNAQKVIGIVNVDIFIPIFTHVIGEAQEGGRYAVTSMYRLRKELDGNRPSMALVLKRLSKAALHEIGHLFGLVHCLDEHCLMHFSGGLRDLDRVTPQPCGYCRKYLAEAIRRHGISNIGTELP